MLPFDYVGRDWRAKNRVRSVLLAIFLGICAALLFPFLLLDLLLWSLGRLRVP
jgi:hypothetical protein